MGAGLAYGYVAADTSGEPAAAGQAKPVNHGVPATADDVNGPSVPAPSLVPAPSPVLPFTAKLVMSGIPAKGGGVRSGGCSGALIAPEWILTAGHCFHDINDVRVGGKPPYATTATVGKLQDSDPGGRTATVLDVRQSPVNDVAMVKLDVAVNDIVPLTVGDRKPTPGQQLEFAGWGTLSAAAVTRTDRVKRGRFTVATIAQTTLEAEHSGARTVENSPCPQDSGAPLFVSDDDRTGTLLGVVSSGPPCPQAGREIIARVDVVSEWIQQEMAKQQ
ncbi:Secreted esterase [Kibdelosporangium sp. 4NS15]|uniref:Secreted esterase n=1 Tax=Kibdelosporangium persicum TaxID=2698649 RepID=A0ABX2FBB7_9PSEU|nr:Secreted esterase [Kibdelosporangium persicum]